MVGGRKRNRPLLSEKKKATKVVAFWGGADRDCLDREILGKEERGALQTCAVVV